MSQEQKFKNFVYRCSSHGIEARFANDSAPDHAYVNLKNMEVRQENAISLRFGRIPLTTNGSVNAPLGGLVNTLGRLKGLAGASWRYGSAAGQLYRGPGIGRGLWSSIATGLSIERCSMVSYTPPFSSTPYEYIADANLMLEDNGTGSPGPWGILWPKQPMIAKAGAVIAGFAITHDSGNTYTNIASHAGFSLINTTATGNIGDDIFSSITPASLTNIVEGRFLQVGPYETFVQSVNTTSGVIYFQSGPPLAQYNVIVSQPALNVVTNAGGGSVVEFNPTLLGAGGWNLAPTIDVGNGQLVLRLNVHNPADLTNLSVQLSSGDTTFTNYYQSPAIVASQFVANAESVINIPLSSLVANGTPSLSSIKAVAVVTNQTAAVTIDFYSIALDYGQGPTVLGGIEYDYLYTYFDNNTGDESGPSPVMLDGAIDGYRPVSMFYLPVKLTWLASTDPRVTHVRIYRRGGTLPAGWSMIAQIPIGATSMYDNASDNQASTGDLLNIDNYPPITSTLPTPVNTTVVSQTAVAGTGGPTVIDVATTANLSVNQRVQVGQGGTRETVTVLQVNPGTPGNFTAYLEFNHNIGETVYAEAAWAQPVNIAQVGFDRIFLAGDPNNPGRLYYSNVGQPSSFGVENFIDLDDTTYPIMGITPVQFGRMNVFTLGGAVYQIISINGSIPVQVRTNATHGMFATQAFVMMDGGVPYLSNDGIYMFNGSNSVEISQFIQWVFRSYAEAGGPIPVMNQQTLIAYNVTNFGFYYDEVFISYVSALNHYQRVIYSARDNRWRNDDIPATAMMYEKDTTLLLYGDANGMVYQDRTGDLDQVTPSVAQAIPFELTTAALDQGFPKNPKVYQEITVDINTRGQPVQVNLLLDNLGTVVPVGTVQTTSRQQVNFTLNQGEGYESLNAGFDLVGVADLFQNVDVYELHFKALVDAEYRQDFDTFFTDYGTNGWKTAKQAYWQYASTLPIVVRCYLDGDMSAAAFTVLLPSTNGNRESLWTRFPPFKAQLYRFVGESLGGGPNPNFQMFEGSYVEVKPLCGQKGYSPAPLAMGS